MRLSRMNPYQKLIERKRTWSPVQMEAGKLKDGSEDVIRRALALRHMELPVGDFILKVLRKAFSKQPVNYWR